MRLKDIGEDRVIKDLARRFAPEDTRLIKGIGDDASVTPWKKGQVLLATTDILIDGVHFKTSYTPARLLGRKAVSISLSDIAAMGGEPGFFLVSLGLPPNTEKVFLDELYMGMGSVARAHGALLAGGNISRAPMVLVSVTIFGQMSAKRVVYRSGARPGEDIYVTGTLGDSALGLKTLREQGSSALKKGPFRRAVKKHLDPVARVDPGRRLSEKGLASAMMDLSDGLLLDLKRLCEASRVGAAVEAARLPLSADMRRYSKVAGKGGARRMALTGGEDYELLFTAPPEKRRPIARLAKRLGLEITRIGTVTPKGIGVRDELGAPVKVGVPGFEHF